VKVRNSLAIHKIVSLVLSFLIKWLNWDFIYNFHIWRLTGAAGVCMDTVRIMTFRIIPFYCSQRKDRAREIYTEN